jgi:hypothetical protein
MELIGVSAHTNRTGPIRPIRRRDAMPKHSWTYRVYDRAHGFHDLVVGLLARHALAGVRKAMATDILAFDTSRRHVVTSSRLTLSNQKQYSCRQQSTPARVRTQHSLGKLFWRYSAVALAS